MPERLTVEEAARAMVEAFGELKAPDLPDDTERAARDAWIRLRFALDALQPRAEAEGAQQTSGEHHMDWDDFRRLDAAISAHAEEFARWRTQRVGIAHGVLDAKDDEFLTLRSTDLHAIPEPLEQIAGPTRGEEEFFRLRARGAMRAALKAASDATP